MALGTISPTVTPETVWMKGYEGKKPQRYIAGRRENTVSVVIFLGKPFAVYCAADQSCKVTVDYSESEGRKQFEDIVAAYGDIFDTTTNIPLMLEDKYDIDNKSAVSSFLNENPTLINALIETHEQIRRIFDKNIAGISLLLNEDPEEDFTGLSIVVKTPLKSELSLALLDKFDDEWWLDLEAEIRNTVTVIVRSV